MSWIGGIDANQGRHHHLRLLVGQLAEVQTETLATQFYQMVVQAISIHKEAASIIMIRMLPEGMNMTKDHQHMAQESHHLHRRVLLRQADNPRGSVQAFRMDSLRGRQSKSLEVDLTSQQHARTMARGRGALGVHPETDPLLKIVERGLEVAGHLRSIHTFHPTALGTTIVVPEIVAILSVTASETIERGVMTEGAVGIGENVTMIEMEGDGEVEAPLLFETETEIETVSALEIHTDGSGLVDRFRSIWPSVASANSMILISGRASMT